MFVFTAATVTDIGLSNSMLRIQSTCCNENGCSLTTSRGTVAVSFSTNSLPYPGQVMWCS